MIRLLLQMEHGILNGPLGAVKPPTTLEVNRKCDFGGYEITVKKMEVTPLLWSLYLDYDEAMKVYEDEKNKFEYTGTDYGMDLYARTSIDQVRYKDGTVLTLDLGPWEASLAVEKNRIRKMVS